jgi:ceramide glucosyltransferase
MMFLDFIFGALATLSFALLLWQWIAARRFPLHQRIIESKFSPAITLLKPLKGCDDSTAESLESWFKQNYAGQIQILFGVADAGDPICKIVKALLKKYSQADAQLVVCSESFGANAKVSTLAQLEKFVKHNLILISDADVRVPPDFLANAVIAMADEKVGLVNCFYRLANPMTAAMQWEAVAINADFWSQVLQSQTLKPLDFALGAAMLTRRNILEGIGGFQSLANCLADDYQLGNRIAKKNYRIELCPVVVECWESPKNWREIWKHQLRWARTIRVCQPLPYFFSILSNATLWPLIWFGFELPKLAASTAQVTQTFSSMTAVSIAFPCGIIIAPAFLLVRIALANDLQRRFSPGQKLISPVWLVPIKDLMQTAIWIFAFAGNTVEWRGRKMKLRRDGTLEANKPLGTAK